MLDSRLKIQAMLWQGPGPGGGSLRVESLDAGLLCYGEPTAFPTPFAAPDLALGASWNLWNNIWGTNYPQVHFPYSTKFRQKVYILTPW